MPDVESQYRPDSQPPPIPNERRAIADLVIAAVNARREYGIANYGTPLQAHNGRDVLTDAFDEALDMVFYLCQAIDERDNPLSGTPVTEQEMRNRLADELDRIGVEAPLYSTRKGFAFAAAIARGVPVTDIPFPVCERCNQRIDNPGDHQQSRCATTQAMNIIEFHFCCPDACALAGRHA